MGGRVVSDEEDEVAEEDDARVVDGDAIEDDDERVRMDDDDEEEEEDGQDEYEKDGFIVDDDEEEEAQGEEEEDREESDEERHKKRKRKKRESEKQYVLDEDDYELLQDNNITGFHRPKPGSKKFKRLKKAGRDAEEERSGFSDEEESDKNGRGGRTAEEKLKRSLFGDDEAAPLEDIAEEEEQVEEEEDADIGEEDEMADFIVDEEDVDENGAPMRRKKTKKKKSRQVLGVSSSALQEAHEIFGDVDELLALRKQDLARGSSDMMGWGEKRLEDEFEPLILEEKYMTPKDDIMRETDVPERIQLSEEITGHPPVDDKSIEEESAWIYNQITTGGASPMFGENQVTKEINKEDIGNVLGMLHVQKLDIPFIAMYRKELCLSLLEDTNQGTPENDETDDPGRIPELRWHKALWAVQNLDRKWLLLRKRKIALEVYYEKRFEEEARRVDDETRLALIRQLYKSIIDALKDAKSEREVDDVDMKFNLNFPPGEVDVDEGQFKRPKRKSLYSICCKAGLWEVAKKFGFSSEQFGLRFSLERMRLDEPEDAKEAPDEVAANFTCAMFETPQDVLKGSRHMAAVEISCEPVVRKHVRGIYMDGAVVSTSPTLEGNLAIDSFHPLAGAKWLQNKPLSAFLDAQWLLIQKAEEEKLLRVTIKMPEEALKKLISEANDNYLSECVSKSAQLWNEQRRLILEDSFFNLILPSMEKEARALLTARAKNWLLMEYGKHLWGKVSVAPYQRPDTEEEDEASRKVMGCCWGPGKPATTFVMLDSAGELLDVLYAGSINVKSQGVNEKQRKNNDQQRLQNFMIDHQPHVVGVGAANMTCKTLKDEINEIIYNIVEHHPRQVGSRFGTAAVFGDESLPRLYENSRVSSDQLPGQPGIVKRAVALARYLQNPLAMVATLCGPGREILSWKLCPLEHFLTADEKYEMVEQIMVDVTNQVGIDINLAASHEWLCAPLQFVSGLGPRKASALQKALARAGSVFSRKEITMGVLRKKAFINAVGFLRVRRSGAAAASSHIIDLLDDTRIHPESYDLAKSMAKVVYSYDADEDVNEMDDDAEEMAIEHVREKPQVLKTLHIVKYAEDVENKLGTRKRETLYDIKMELLHGFQDWRTAFREPDQDEEFYMISGETDETISDGKIVQVTVRWVQEQRIFCSLDSGLRGIITVADDFSDNNEDAENVLERVHEGDVLTCKIKNIQKHRCQVYLTCKESELRKRSNKFTRDTYYKEDEINVQSEQDKAQKEKKLAKKHFRPRMIVHPRFQNVSCDEAIEFLSGKDPGESVIRPSSRGPSYLTLTIKVSDDCHADKEIIEGDKDHKDITSLLRLGKKLTIGVDTFEDLDEVMDRFVDPLVTHMRNMLAYRKFRKGTKAEIDDLLRAEKVENPMRIVYCFGISYEHPGAFILTYIRNSNPHHELVGVGPKGFRFRKRDFDDIDRLVSHFQRHIDERVHDSGPSMRSVAAVVPMRSPAIGGSSGGGSVGGSWSVSPDGSDGWRNHTSSDRERSSTPGSRMGGRFDHRNSSGARDGHPSGLPRPFERGHGRGRGNPRNEGQDTGYSSGRWGSGSRDDDLSSFPGAKIQNSPGKERFPGGWVGGNGDSGTGGWANGGNGGWGSSREGAGTGGN
uniref:Transcription elongation factor spt6 n=1 Tax=Anthurium amnicola TaxID=1678845 RepID=A0A1D1YSQ9_9ARAE